MDENLQNAVKFIPPGYCPICKTATLVLIQKDMDVSFLDKHGRVHNTENCVRRTIQCINCNNTFEVKKMGDVFRPLHPYRSEFDKKCLQTKQIGEETDE